MDWVRLLSRLVQAESLPGKEEEVAGLLLEALKALGLPATLDEAGNVEALLGEKEPEVVLTGHMDVVPVGDLAHWPYPQGAVVGERLYGRGAVDMKGALVAMLLALEALSQRPLRGRVRFLAVVQEEVGGLGSRHAALRLSPLAFILGEPSGGRLMRGHRGRAEIWADFEGEEAHAALASGENPLYDLGEYLLALKDLPLPQGLKLTPPGWTPTPGPPTRPPGWCGFTWTCATSPRRSWTGFWSASRPWAPPPFTSLRRSGPRGRCGWPSPPSGPPTACRRTTPSCRPP
nr:M20/M25/M40 family metallo-hydrolase [Thermus brockianus]